MRKKKIAILGSTGSIGKTLINLCKKRKEYVEIKLLSTNKNYKLLFKQAKYFNVKNLIIFDEKTFEKIKKNKKYINFQLFNDTDSYKKIFKSKLDYTMSSITGIDGLNPTIEIIKFTKSIAIANKEAIICGWRLIQKELFTNKVKFIPVDSEHFSLWFGLQNIMFNKIDTIYLTASGGPLNKLPIKKIKKVSIRQALNHPNWNMGKKISIDSATLVNKIYEVIEAKNIFNIPYNKIKIIIHPKSYVHAIIKFNNGLIKIIAHDTTMKIPIFNSLFFDTSEKLKSNKINLNFFNSLDFQKPNVRKFPMLKILEILPKKNSLFETVIVSANDTLVDLFLKKKISFVDIQKKLFNIIKSREFNKYKKIYPYNSKDIINLNHYVRLKILKKCI